MNPFLAIAIALLIGALFGTAMGCLIRWFELPPFLVTLAGMFLARGMGFVVHPQSLGIEHPFFLQHITEDLSIHLTERVSLPFTATCYLVILLVALFVAHYTPFGRYIYALGGDEQSATLMGLPVDGPRFLPTPSRDSVRRSPASSTRSIPNRVIRHPVSGLNWTPSPPCHWGHAFERRRRIHGRHRDGRAYPRIDSDAHHFSGKSEYMVDAHCRRNARASLHPSAKRHYVQRAENSARPNSVKRAFI